MTTSAKRVILITNDDGITSPGLLAPEAALDARADRSLRSGQELVSRQPDADLPQASASTSCRCVSTCSRARDERDAVRLRPLALLGLLDAPPTSSCPESTPAEF
jgi:hypothetical protein